MGREGLKWKDLKYRKYKRRDPRGKTTDRKNTKIKGYIGHGLYGMLFVLIYLVGKTICENHDLSGIAQRPLPFLMTLLLGGAAVGAALMIVYRGLALVKNISVCKPVERLFAWRHVYLCMWLLLTAVYFLCFLAYYPGTFAYDMPAQTWQAYGYAEYNTYQPVLHTLLWAFFIRLGERMGKEALALVFYSVFQLICVTALSTVVVLEVKRITANGYAAILAFLYYLLVPSLHLMSFSTTKDIFFSCFITLFMLSLYEGMRAGNKRNCLGIVGFGLLSCLFRNNMIYVVLAALLVSQILRCPARIKVLLLMVTVLYVGVVKGIFPAAGVKEGPGSEALPVPISQLSGVYVRHPEILSEEEKDSILAYMPNAADFNPRIADYVKSSFNDALLEEDSAGFWKTYLSVLKKAPVEYLNIFLDLNVGYWYLDAPFPDPYDKRTYIETTTGEVLDFFSAPSENHLPAVRACYDKVAAHDHLCMKLPVIRYFYALAFPLMLLMVCLYLAVRGRNRMCILPLTLLAALFLTYLLGPVSLFRYLYPYYLSLPLYFCMAAKTCGNGEIT